MGPWRLLDRIIDWLIALFLNGTFIINCVSVLFISCCRHIHLYFTVETVARKYAQLNSEKQLLKYE